MSADLTALEEESFFEVEEDGACEPWGLEMQEITPADDSTAGFALARRVLNFLFSQVWPRMPVLLKCTLRLCSQYTVACSWFRWNICNVLSTTYQVLHALLQLLFLTSFLRTLLLFPVLILVSNKASLLLSEMVCCGVTGTWKICEVQVLNSVALCTLWGVKLLPAPPPCPVKAGAE